MIFKFRCCSSCHPIYFLAYSTKKLASIKKQTIHFFLYSFFRIFVIEMTKLLHLCMIKDLFFLSCSRFFRTFAEIKTNIFV